jgi:hypothetical protein
LLYSGKKKQQTFKTRNKNVNMYKLFGVLTDKNQENLIIKL